MLRHDRRNLHFVCIFGKRRTKLLRLAMKQCWSRGNVYRKYSKFSYLFVFIYSFIVDFMYSGRPIATIVPLNSSRQGALSFPSEKRCQSHMLPVVTPH